MQAKSAVLAALLAGALVATASAQGREVPLESLRQASEWLNSPPLSTADLRGKVVLVDFWTYTCVNWLRTLPYLRAWSERYREQGLVVVGVHSPEFGFERDGENVRRARAALGVDYPIAVDTDHAIWNAFHNRYWPAAYLVDASGRIRFEHFGEGDYDRLEEVIKKLLSERGATVPAGPATAHASGAEVAADRANLRSGENYTGSERTQDFASPEGLGFGWSWPGIYSVPEKLALNQWALAGRWSIKPEASVLERAPGKIVYRFHARDVNVVMGATHTGRAVRFRVRIDGVAPGAAHGVDSDAQGAGSASEPRLYQLIRQPAPIEEHDVEIEFFDAGAEVYSFTFG